MKAIMIALLLLAGAASAEPRVIWNNPGAQNECKRDNLTLVACYNERERIAKEVEAPRKEPEPPEPPKDYCDG